MWLAPSTFHTASAVVGLSVAAVATVAWKYGPQLFDHSVTIEVTEVLRLPPAAASSTGMGGRVNSSSGPDREPSSGDSMVSASSIVDTPLRVEGTVRAVVNLLQRATFVLRLSGAVATSASFSATSPVARAAGVSSQSGREPVFSGGHRQSASGFAGGSRSGRKNTAGAAAACPLADVETNMIVDPQLFEATGMLRFTPSLADEYLLLRYSAPALRPMIPAVVVESCVVGASPSVAAARQLTCLVRVRRPCAALSIGVVMPKGAALAAPPSFLREYHSSSEAQGVVAPAPVWRVVAAPAEYEWAIGSISDTRIRDDTAAARPHHSVGPRGIQDETLPAGALQAASFVGATSSGGQQQQRRRRRGGPAGSEVEASWGGDSNAAGGGDGYYEGSLAPTDADAASSVNGTDGWPFAESDLVRYTLTVTFASDTPRHAPQQAAAAARAMNTNDDDGCDQMYGSSDSSGDVAPAVVCSYTMAETGSGLSVRRLQIVSSEVLPDPEPSLVLQLGSAVRALLHLSPGGGVTRKPLRRATHKTIVVQPVGVATIS